MPQHPIGIPAPALLSPSITTNTGTQVKSGAGVLMGISVLAAGTAWQVEFYDGTSTGGTPLAIVLASTTGTASTPPIKFSTGLFAQTSGTTAGTLKVAYF